MAEAETVAEIDHKGRLTIPEPARKKLGLNDMEQGEKRLVDLDIEYDGN